MCSSKEREMTETGKKEKRKVLLGSNRRLRNDRQEPLRSAVSYTLKDTCE